MPMQCLKPDNKVLLSLFYHTNSSTLPSEISLEFSHPLKKCIYPHQSSVMYRKYRVSLIIPIILISLKTLTSLAKVTVRIIGYCLKQDS